MPSPAAPDEPIIDLPDFTDPDYPRADFAATEIEPQDFAPTDFAETVPMELPGAVPSPASDKPDLPPIELDASFFDASSFKIKNGR